MENDTQIFHTFNSELRCKSCGGNDISYRAIYNKPTGMLILRSCCNECGFSRSLPTIENLNRRTNTTLANWRKQVINRDKGMCVICGSKDLVQAHHIIPVMNDYGDNLKYNIHNGITLCEKCHWMVHNKAHSN